MIKATFTALFLAVGLIPAAVLVDVSATANSGLSNTSSTASIRIQNGNILTNSIGGLAETSSQPFGLLPTRLAVSALSYTSVVPTVNYARNNAVVSADLATGALRVESENVAINAGISLSSGIATFEDTLTFNNTSGGVSYLGFANTITGVVNGPLQNAFIYGNLRMVSPTSNVNFDSPTGLVVVLGEVMQFNYNQGISSFQSNSGQLGSHWTRVADGNGGGTIGGILVFQPGTSQLNIRMTLSVDCRMQSECRYGDTSQFSFGALPSGLTYTSESGVFLTELGNPNPVPEPRSAALALLGFLSLASLKHRSKAKQQKEA
jgi:hypothetical protein